MLIGQTLWAVVFSMLTLIVIWVGASWGTHEPNDVLVVLYLILGAPLILALPFSENTVVVAACGFVFGLGIYGIFGALAAWKLDGRLQYQVALRSLLVVTSIIAVVVGLVACAVR
jgi:hypothetical protein